MQDSWRPLRRDNFETSFIDTVGPLVQLRIQDFEKRMAHHEVCGRSHRSDIDSSGSQRCLQFCQVPNRGFQIRHRADPFVKTVFTLRGLRYMYAIPAGSSLQKRETSG